MKICRTCGESRPLTDFHRRGDKHQSKCKPCNISQRVAYYKNNKQKENSRNKAVFNEIRDWYRNLKNNPCVDCGKIFHFSAMQYDHVGEVTKNGSLANIVKSGNKNRILEEISKCELVCANCHAVRTWTRSIGV
jgi:hypothetical protein